MHFTLIRLLALACFLAILACSLVPLASARPSFTAIRLCPDADDYGCSHANCQLVTVPLSTSSPTPPTFPSTFSPGSGNFTIRLLEDVALTWTLEVTEASGGGRTQISHGMECEQDTDLHGEPLFWEVVFPIKAPCTLTSYDSSLLPNCPSGAAQNLLPFVPDV